MVTKLGISTHDARHVWVELKSNNGSKSEKPRWIDYEAYEDTDDIDDDGFEDETIGHNEGFWQPRNRREFRNRARGQFKKRGNICNFRGHDDIDGNLDAIKLKIHIFLGKNDLEAYLEWEKKIDWIFLLS